MRISINEVKSIDLFERHDSNKSIERNEKNEKKTNWKVCPTKTCGDVEEWGEFFIKTKI